MIRYLHRQTLQRSVLTHCRYYASAAAQSVFSNETIQDAKPYSDIPKVKGYPIVGTIPDWITYRTKIIFKIHKLLQNRVNDYGPIYREKLNTGNVQKELVFTANVDDWELVCRSVEAKGTTNVRNGTWSTQAYSKKQNRPPFISDMQGDEYKRIKESVKSLMMPKEIAKNVPILSEATEDYTKLLEAKMDSVGIVRDIRRLTHMWTFECGGGVVFRQRLGVLNPENQDVDIIKVFNASQVFFKLFGKLEFGLPHHKSLLTSSWKEYEEALDTLYKLTKSYFAKHGEFITDKSSNLSTEERESVAMSVLIAASDTTAHTALWTLIELSNNLEVQEQLYEEIKKVYNGGEMTYKHLQIPYLRGFLKEVFRTKPIIPMFRRITCEDVVLSGYHVPAGTLVSILLSGYNQNEWFTNADVLDPERYKRARKQKQEQNDVPVRNPFAILPFGFGHRSCLGRRLAENELYLYIAKMVYKNKIHPVKDYEGITNLFVTPQGDIDIKLEKRN